MIVFSRSIWKPFKERFGQQMSNFREHRDNVDREANLSHMLEKADRRALPAARRVEDAREKQGRYSPSIFGQSADSYLAQE